MKNIIRVSLIIFGIIIIAGIIFVWDTKRKIDQGEMVKWEGRWYTKEQIREKFGQQYYDTPAKNTPEEVYAAFRTALLAGDTEKALAQMRPERREEYRQAFKNKERFDGVTKKLPKKLDNIRIKNNLAVYDWDQDDNLIHTIEFTKNKDGYWQLDII